MFWAIQPQFDKLLEKATSHYLMEPDWPAILQICDLIRQGDVQPKTVIASIKKKLPHPNPHVALYSLLVLESCVKNCGSIIHDEVCTKQFMEYLRDLAKTSPHEVVKSKILELIQVWAFAFRSCITYRAVQDILNIMKAEGYKFPTLKESDAMFSADTAPEWRDGDTCNRCRVEFSFIQRKHHCRACGQVFCNQCSNKFSPIPKYGIEKDVRVCEACYEKINKAAAAATTSATKETDLPAEYLNSSLAQQQQVPPRKSEEELQEEEEFQLALALSQSEAEQKEKDKKRVSKSAMPATTRTKYSPPASPLTSPSKMKDQEADHEEEEEEVDPELAKYLNRQYWEQRQSAIEDPVSRVSVASPSAPNIGSPMPQNRTVFAVTKQQNGEVDSEIEHFVSELRSQVEIFVNRMKSNSSRGRSIAIDSSVQSLFMTVTDMHSKLLRYIQEQDDKRVYYEGLQDKLVQIKDARAALDALREEHREKLRRQAEEAERLRQMQMAQKLEIMRKKKQEYLQYQRQLALQRIQEQEREMQMRQEQQKQQYIMGGYQPTMGYMGPNPQESPRHMQYPPTPSYNVPMSPTQNPNMYVYSGQPQMGQYGAYGMSQQQVPVDMNTRDSTLGRVTVSGAAVQVNQMPGASLPSVQQPMPNSAAPMGPGNTAPSMPVATTVQAMGPGSAAPSMVPGTSAPPMGPPMPLANRIPVAVPSGTPVTNHLQHQIQHPQVMAQANRMITPPMGMPLPGQMVPHGAQVIPGMVPGQNPQPMQMVPPPNENQAPKSSEPMTFATPSTMMQPNSVPVEKAEPKPETAELISFD